MRPELEIYHTIDRYLNGELAGEELNLVESKLKSDPTFAEEMELQKITNLVVLGAGYDKLRQQMKRDIQKRDMRRSNWKKVAIGTAALLFAGLVYYFYDVKEKLVLPVQDKNQEVGHIPTKKMTSVKREEKMGSVPNDNKSVPSVLENKKKEMTKSTPLAPLPISFPKQDAKENGTIKHLPSSVTVIAPTSGTKAEIVEEVPASSMVAISALKKEVMLPSSIRNKEEVPNRGPEKAKMNKFTIQPNYGETWNIPVSDEQQYVLSIYNRAGQLIFKHNSSDRHLSEWEGENMTGGVTDAGIYVYVIEYQNGVKETGQITLIK